MINCICEGLGVCYLISVSILSYILQRDFCCKLKTVDSAKYTRHTCHGKQGNLWEKTITIFFLQYVKEKLLNTLHFVTGITRISLWKMEKGIILKVVSATFLLVCFKVQTRALVKLRKMLFYFTPKPLFVLEKIKF